MRSTRIRATRWPTMGWLGWPGRATRPAPSSTLMRAGLGDRSMLDDVDFLVKAPTALRLYNAACALAVYAETTRDPRPLERSIQLLELAFKAGFSTRIATADPDLKALRYRPDFARLIARF